MSDLHQHLQICGGLLLALSALHTVFPRRFRWSEDLAQLTLLNRQIFWVHTYFLCLILVLMGLVCLFAPAALLERSTLGIWVAAGLMLFWQMRLLTQHFIYDSRLWRGKLFETTIHVLFTLLWSYFSLVYGWLLWHQIRG